MESGFIVRRKRRWKVPALIAAILIALFFAPAIITRTSLLDRVVQSAVPELEGRLDYASVDASWFSPVEIQGLQVRDLQNQPLLSAERISTGRTLWGLVTHRKDVGLIHVSNPEILVRLTSTGSNVEDLISVLSSDEASSAEPVAAKLQIDNGLIVIQDAVSDQSWQFSQTMLNCSLPASDGKPLTGAIFAQLSDQQTSGKISGQFQYFAAKPGIIPSSVSPLPPSIGAGQIQLETKEFPLNLASLLMRRMEVAGGLVGYCDTKLDCQWGNRNGSMVGSVVGHIQLTDSQIALPDYLGTDQLVLNKVNAIVDGQIDNDLVTARAVNLTTDHGRVKFSGSAPLNELTGNDIVATLLSPGTQNSYQLQGRIDLAGLLAALPSTFQVRDGTVITSGDLQFDVSSLLDEGQRALVGTLEARGLGASRGGQSFAWSQPVQVDFKGISNTDGIVIEKATCNSDFFQAQATGQIDQGNLVATADLNRLVVELGQFFDLRGNQLAGKIQSNIHWQSVGDANMKCDAQLELSDFVYATSGQQTESWTESLLRINGEVTVGLSNYSLQSIQSGNVRVQAMDDVLTASLTQAVPNVDVESSFPLGITIGGNIQNWLTRARPWFQTDSWNAAGLLQAELQGSFSPQLVNIEQAKATVTNLDFTHPSIHAQESVVQLQGVASWNGQTGQVVAPWFTLTGTTIALRGENIEVATAGEAVAASGQAAFRADAGRLYQWIQDPQQPTTARLHGIAEGRIQARTQGAAVAFRVNSTVREYAYQQLEETGGSQLARGPGASLPVGQNGQFAAPNWSTVWSEESLSLNSNGTYDASADQVTFEAINVVGKSVQLEANGQLASLSVAPNADLNGRMTYDLQSVLSQLQLGPEIKLFGQQTHPFAIQGPLTATTVLVSQPIASASPVPPGATSLSGSQLDTLVPPELNARATLGWEGASIYGVPLGPGQLTAQLAQGVVMSSPLDIQVGPSQIHFAPTVHLNANPMTLVVEPGRLADSVEITPEMCGTWLKYITPLFSDAAAATGTFSVDLAGTQVPLNDPMQSAVNGKLLIHQAHVQPGPLAGQIVNLTDQVTQLIGEKKQNLDFLSADKSWMEIAENQVDFQMQQGRVYHRNLNVNVGKVQVSTEGWVGVDQTMSMIASIPILDEWIDGEPLLEGLRGRKLAVPIQGSFDNPHIDRESITRFSKELVGSAAKNYLQGELQKGLQKLIKGR